MKLSFALGLTLLTVAACGAQDVVPVAASPCVDSGPAFGPLASIVDSPDQPPAGRALYVDHGSLQVTSAGSRERVSVPYPVRQQFAHFAADGSIVALVAGPSPDGVSMWTQGIGGRPDTLVGIPAPFAPDASVALWSPDGRRLVYVPSFNASEVWVTGMAPTSQRASLGSDLAHLAVWRSDTEVTLMTSSPQTRFPLAGVTLWSWRPPLAPVRMAGPITLAGYPAWSPDGQTLATLEDDGRNRILRLRGAIERTVLTDGELSRGEAGCARASIVLTGLQWSPDSKHVVVLGHGGSDLVALLDLNSQKTHVFAAPLGSGSCYIPGRVAFAGRQVVVPFFGPDCGLGPTGLGNALALLDSVTGTFQGYVPISRKGFLRNSDRWVAIAGGLLDSTVTTFFSLDDPTRWSSVPLSGLADYCCTQ